MVARENKPYFQKAEIKNCQNMFLFKPYVREKMFDEDKFNEIL